MRFAPGLIGFLVALALVTPATTTLAQTGIVLQPVITSVPTPPARSPAGLVNAGDGSGRLFLVIQQGEILVLSGGAVQSPAFLDIRSDVLCCGERGLLGVAFHPQFEANGFFWVYYTDLTGANVLARFQASPPSSGVVDPATRRILFSDTQPGSNHNGGQLAFGPDGFLYVSKGDGGDAGNAQSLSTRLGKILRIQPSLGAAAPFYTVPASNPFVGTPGAAPEIWAYGLRNTWRFTFDRLTGDMFPADVGEISREEVNFQPAGAAGGRNYGWPKMEGTLCVNPPTNCNPTGAFVEPILEYAHAEGNCSITGGFRYRGDDFPSLAGIYFYADFCTGRIWGATESGGSWTTQELLDTTLGIPSFGEGEDGELYVVSRAGAVYRITAAGGSPDLRIESLGLSAASVAPGGQVTVSYNVANRGTGTVSQTYTDRIHLSTNATLGADTLVGTSHGHTVPLAANATHAHSQAVAIPAGATHGNYFILVQADALGAIGESNEGNNVTAIPITVTP
jgi:glucose/arabinose dehydrogenase